MFRNYLLTAWKVFMRRKLFTAINLLCIVLTLVVLMVITSLLEFTFFPTGVEGRSDRFVQVMMMESRGPVAGNVRRGTLGYKVIDQYLRPLKSAEAVAATSMPDSVSIYQEGRVSTLQMRHTDANYWKILDFKVLAGRVYDDADVQAGRFGAVINASTAKKLFPDSAAVGQKIEASGQRFEIIGVVEDAMHLNAYADIWVPVTTYPSSEYKSQVFGGFVALILARSHADIAQIQREVALASTTVQYDDPKVWNRTRMMADTKLELFARMLNDDSPDADPGTAYVVGGIVTFMLLFMLLPALNLVNLNMGRILERSAEIGVRKAFGATGRQLVGQLVLENIVLCLAGGLLAFACAQGVLAWIGSTGLIPYLHLNLNLAVFAYGLVLTIVFGLFSGVIPAWKMSRLDPVHALKGAA
ncbi:MAG: ABC transporter permease [Pseudomonadota bacterium]